MNRALSTYEEAEAHNKLSHFTVQGFDLNGIIHVGANDGEEMENAHRMGVEHLIAFEPLKSAYDLLVANCGAYTTCFDIGLHNEDTTAELYVTAGDGKGSSILETNWDHPEVLRNWNQGQAAIVGKEEITLRRFDTWIEEQDPQLKHLIQAGHYDTLQLDTQGNEMEILEGMGEWIRKFKYLAIEISEVPVYKGETPGAEISDWLATQGFLRDSPITAHNDTFFIRTDIKWETDGQYKGRC